VRNHWLILLSLSTTAAAYQPAIPVQSASDIFDRSRAVYAQLTSYSDAGRVDVEYGTTSVDHHTFLTRFSRAPRRFLLDFTKEGGDRYVIWGDPDAFHTWWKTTGVVTDYPNPNNVPALNASRNAGNTTQKIPALLYAKAPLLSDFAYLSDITDGGTEVVGTHRCHRIDATAHEEYGTGHQVNARHMSIFIDTQSLLIVRVVEEWTPLPGSRQRTITTYEPAANPALDEARFAFRPPQGK
jgi:hypothetical protein